jgi:hypothetical protein
VTAPVGSIRLLSSTPAWCRLSHQKVREIIRRNRALVLKDNEVPTSVVFGYQCSSRRRVTIASVEICEVPCECRGVSVIGSSLDGCV